LTYLLQFVNFLFLLKIVIR